MAMTFDFSGWATKNDLRCADGRTIRKNAFADNDGKVVPLVWQHSHDSPENVLGHALLENRDDGVYCYGVFNDTDRAEHAKALVQHGDIVAMSIYANQLKENSNRDVLHGNIREVSLVLAPANPAALIDNIIMHDGVVDDQSAVIYTGEPIDADTIYELYNTEEELKHSEEDNYMNKERTIKDVYDEMTDEQKDVLHYLLSEAVDEAEADYDEYEYDEDEDYDDYDDELEQYDMEGDYMKSNVFDTYGDVGGAYLSHGEIELYEDKASIFADAKRVGSFKDAILSHAATYGIDNVDYLFPDPKNVENQPGWIKREDAWVTDVMNSISHSPFSRIKSMFADITADEARAKGYTKGNRKLEEVFTLLKRTTVPTTVYKKQKIDRDDVLDITDFDVISWIKSEMKMMLNEEIARAILIGDGRSGASNDKIDEQKIRPILNDDALFSIKVPVSVALNDDADRVARAAIKTAIKSRKLYKGSGNPTLYTTDDWLTDMLLLEDGMGRRLYKTMEELATAIRVKKIVTVPVMENLTRSFEDPTTHTTVTRPVIGIIVNLTDYKAGSDRNGGVAMFDDFDIDYNQQKYLMETRMSGALVKPYSAMVLELDRASE